MCVPAICSAQVILFCLTMLTPVRLIFSYVPEGAALALQCTRVMRMIRALRIVRAAKVAPKLALVLESLIKSISSVAYIFIFTVLNTYLFAIVGCTIFKKNDPFHFGNLFDSMVTLFRIATLDSWGTIMYFLGYGDNIVFCRILLNSGIV